MQANRAQTNLNGNGRKMRLSMQDTTGRNQPAHDGDKRKNRGYQGARKRKEEARIK